MRFTDGAFRVDDVGYIPSGFENRGKVGLLQTALLHQLEHGVEIRKAMARGGRYGSRGLLPSVTGVRLEGRRPGAIRCRYVVLFGRIGRCFWAERPTRRFGGFAIRGNRFKGSQVVLDERIGLLASVDVVAQENRQTLAGLPLLIAELAESIFVGGNRHGGFNILKPRLS